MSSEPVSESRVAAQQTFAQALEPLLGNQLGRLRRRYLLHGIAFTVLLPALAIGLFFLLDHSLRLPVAIRLLHTLAVLVVLGFAVARFLTYPLSRKFSSLDIAQALERSFPELHQRMVSAVQLQQVSSGQQPGQLRNQSAAMIDELVAETATAARDLPLDRFFDTRRTRRVGAVAALAMVTLTIGAIAAPTTAKTFVLRHLGMSAEYPRQTYLTVDLPPAGPEMHRVDRDGVTELLLPAGGELHVSVLATGVVPKEVFLEVTSLRQKNAGGGAPPRASRSIPMTPRPGDRFRYVFRKVSGAFEFHARGGDDERGDLLVSVRTIRPPQVATIRASVQPPAYTGVDRIEQTGGAVEALLGSQVELFVTTTAPVQSATMVFLESGRRIELEPTTIQDDSGAATAHRTEFAVQGSDRYQIELLGSSGLRNPNPGTYPITGLQDYAPVGRWLLPGDEAALLLPGGLLCIRTEARDDFGLAAVDFTVERAGAEVRTEALLPPPETGTPRTTAVLTELFEVRDLLGGGPDAGRGGVGLSLLLTIRDNCAPTPGSVELPRRIVQIVDGQQLAESIAKSFRRMREETSQALDIQVDRRGRLEELAEREGVSALETAQMLSAVEVGQSRVLGSCERLHRGLMTSFDIHLWNRLDSSPNAELVVELYRQFSSGLTQPLARAPEFYRDLVDRRASGTLGAMETALDPILQMIAIADSLATTDVPAAARSLAQAQVALPEQRSVILQGALQQQQVVAESLQLLLNRLEEWNDYQDTVQEARALRDRQRDLQMRTEELRGKK